MKVLSLSSVYPNPAEPGLGLFVRARLEQMAAQAEVKVIAPVPLLDYSSPNRNLLGRRASPFTRQDGPLEVFHPRWLFPPRGTPLNVICQFLRLLPLVRSIRKTFPFDLIDAHFGYPEGAVAALLSRVFRVPFTITLRGSEPVFAASPVRRRMIRWAMRRAAHVIAVSDQLRKFALQEGVAPQCATTIPNGVDAAVFYPRDRPPAHHPIIVSAGELIEAKGHHLVIHAVRALLDSGLDVHLLIVGGAARGGPRYEHHLRQSVSELGLEGNVRFTGWVDRQRLAELLSAADVFCLASFTEGWPNVVHEALACGTPVVASAVGGIPAMLPDAACGFTVPPRNLAALIAALECSLTRPWNRSAISQWGRSRTWATVAFEVIRIQQSLIQISRSPSPVSAAPGWRSRFAPAHGREARGAE